MVIITPEAGAEDVNAALERLKGIITGKGGAVDEVVMWGKRKLAYPINHAAEGSYALIRFKANPSANKELTENMRISEKLLRYLLVKTDEG